MRVPGTCPVGKKGLWYRFSGANREYTQAAACYFRDKIMSSTDSVLVLVVLGLDTPTITPNVVAWEMTICTPPSPPEEQADGMVPPIGFHSLTALKSPLLSPVDSITAPTMMALTGMSNSLDYGDPDSVTQATRGVHRRHAPAADSQGFELQAPFTTIVSNHETPTYIFTITERGATPNLVRTTGRYIWHSEQRCIEEIVRRRTPKDFAYVSKKRTMIGGNNPRIFAAYTRHGKFDRLVAGGYRELLKEYEMTKAKEEKKRKEEALRLKIEAANARRLANKVQEDMVNTAVRQKELRVLEKLAPSRKRSSMERWKKRLAHSILLGQRDRWEKRKHEPSGNTFYHLHGEFAPDAFTHDPPSPWLDVNYQDGDINTNTGDDTKSVADMTISAYSTTSPAETLLALPNPADGTISSTLDPSIQASTTNSTSDEVAKALDETGKKHSKHIDEILENLASNDVLISKLADKIGAQAFVPLMKRDKTVEPLDRQLEEDER